MDIGRLIYEKRKEKGMTLQELGDRVGVGKSTVRKWEIGMIQNMRRDKIAKLADALDISPALLMEWKEEISMPPVPEIEDGPVAPIGASVPVLGRVAAGIPIEMIEDVIDTEDIPMELAKKGTFFGLKIVGDSMEPRIYDGDVVIVRKQDYADDKDIVIATVNGNDATCKRLLKHGDGITLMPLNPRHEPQYFTAEQVENIPVRIIGKVEELRGKLIF